MSIQPFSPYHYVNLDPARWQSHQDELLNAAPMPDRRAADAWVQDELSKKVISELYRFPENELSSFKSSKVPKDICVIGGGIAGLTAAYELANKGNKVHLLEASSRLGGRMWTHRFDSNTYGELGAMRIPANHGCVWHYIKHFKLATREFVSHNIDAFLYLREGCQPLKDFAKLQKLFNLRPPGRNCNGRSPLDAAEEFIQYHMAKLTISDFKSIFQEFDIPPQLRELEQFSLGQFMRGDYPSKFGYFGPDACEYLGRGTGMLWFDQASCLQFILNELALKEPNKEEIVGGMVRLIDSFKTALTTHNGIVELNCPVTGVEIANKPKVRVTWRTSRGEKHGDFDYVVCATPAGATLRLRFAPPLAPQVYEALTNLSYASSGKTIIRADHRFWEKDGIFGGGKRETRDVELYLCADCGNKPLC
jgi:monoamine oxidase